MQSGNNNILSSRVKIFCDKGTTPVRPTFQTSEVLWLVFTMKNSPNGFSSANFRREFTTVASRKQCFSEVSGQFHQPDNFSQMTPFIN
ncbi:hypothetical protein CDAR_88561 [Caerostris darwini]|uniref:Uncharacterized protein n=1 Tax=Caerostris darwini TaxID=1538125 RepID=A0AAV4NJC4_9ARAC|nr:hypothetical protein CDAR_88561 [Caerostris darwini]